MSKERNELADYLFSGEYLYLLERAIYARMGTTTNNFDKHAEATMLIAKFKDSKHQH